MNPPPLGTKVTIDHTLKRIARHDAKLWLKVPLPEPITGILVGHRNLADGTRRYDSEEGYTFKLTRRFPAYVIAFNLKRRHVLAESLLSHEPEVQTLVEQYRSIRDQLVEHRRQTFPKGSKVRVAVVGRYQGPGIVDAVEGSAPDQLAVRLGNGNTWWYPIEACQPEPTTTNNRPRTTDQPPCATSPSP